MPPFSSQAHACGRLYIRHTHVHTSAQSIFRYLLSCFQGLVTQREKHLFGRVRWCHPMSCQARNTRPSSKKFHYCKHKEIRPRSAGTWRGSCLCTHYFHEGEARAVNLKDAWCRGSRLQDKDGQEAAHIFHEHLVCNWFLCLAWFLNKFVFPAHHSYSPVSLFSLPLWPSFSATPVSGSIQLIR